MRTEQTDELPFSPYIEGGNYGHFFSGLFRQLRSQEAVWPYWRDLLGCAREKVGGLSNDFAVWPVICWRTGVEFYLIFASGARLQKSSHQDYAKCDDHATMVHGLVDDEGHVLEYPRILTSWRRLGPYLDKFADTIDFNFIHFAVAKIISDTMIM